MTCYVLSKQMYVWWIVVLFFNNTATTEIYTLSLHDALPIFREQHADLEPSKADEGQTAAGRQPVTGPAEQLAGLKALSGRDQDRKSTRLNSSHANISYAVFCLKKKKELDSVHTVLYIACTAH